jgi:V8-like Glu-specific endopeptidase
MMLDRFQIQQTLKRYEEREGQRTRNEDLIKKGRLLEVDSPERVDKFLKRRGLVADIEGGLTVERTSAVMAGEVAGLAAELALERYLGTNDLMGVAFLEEGLRVARTIARIWVGVSSGQPAGYGTGFMVSPQLMITNHHVLGAAATARNSLAEFDYQRRADGTLLTSAVFSFEPHVFFYADQELDYAVVAVRGTSSNGRSLADFGHNLLSEEEGKAIAAQWANVVQHPGGEPKQVSLREDQIVDVLPNFLHYKSDTAPGSSGAAVYNDRWEIVALHHSGVPDKTADGRIKAIGGTLWRPDMGDDRVKWIANEGVRISRIIRHLRGQLASDAHRALFTAMLAPSSESQPLVADRSRQPLPTVGGQAGTLTTTSDGSAIWTIPLTVSINVGGSIAAAAAPVSAPAGPPPPSAAPPAAPPPGPGDGRSPDEVLAAARAAFKDRSNVMGVRLGFVFKDGRITQERALVVTVREKKSLADLKAAGIEELPASFGGLRVQVTDPTIAELILAEKCFAAAEALALSADALAAEITYKPPPQPGLKRVKERMKVTAHVSPDAGWTQLKGFLAGTTRTLTVGMYDFGAPHIAEAIETAGRKRGFQAMTLTLQPGQSVGTGTKANDLTDKEAVEGLRDALGRRFKNAWVKIGLVNGWVASSYHIKVAVRDKSVRGKSAFWLSSGNWQSSNQPAADPLKKPWKRSWLSEYNREWHAIVEHRGLAAEFEKYLLHDFSNNVDVGTSEALILPDILVPDEVFMPTVAERAAPFKYFEPLSETRTFDVQPLLTPDNYHGHVLDLIKSANEELLIQNQTFNAPKANHVQLRELLSAVLDKQKAGVQVRIIFRIIMKADARKNLEALQEFGFDMDSIKVQKNCHTKGIIVDRERVMLGSQNWSEQGVSLNRDASLLFADVKLAKYFADIFEHDWNNLASDSIDIMPSGAELATTADATRPGYTKISVEEYLETL